MADQVSNEKKDEALESHDQPNAAAGQQPTAAQTAATADGVAEAGLSEQARAQGAKYLVAIAVVVFLVIGSVVAWNALRQPSVPVTPAAAEELLRVGQFAEADQIVRQLLEREPENIEYQILLARVLAAQERYKEAAEVLEQIQGSPLVRARVLFRAGQAWLEARYRRKAEDCFKQVLALRPKQAIVGLPEIQQAARRELAGMYALERRRPDFRRITWEAYQNELPERRHEPLASRLRYEVEMVDPSVAIAQLEPAIELDPKDVYTRRALGIYHLEAANASEARGYLIRCVQEAPNDPIMWEAWLRCLARVGESIQIERALSQIPKAAESSDVCWRFRAQLLSVLGRSKEAAEAAQQAVKLNPWSSENHYQLGQMLMRIGKQEQAQQHIARSKELQEIWDKLLEQFARFRNEWDVLADEQARCDLAYQIGQYCEQIGWFRDAYGWYDVALNQVPTHTPSIAARERLQAKLEEGNE